MPIFGVDVSKWRGDVDWSRAHSADINFAFAKVTEGTKATDSQWAENRKGMLGLGEDFLPGAYHFLSAGDVEKQVRHFLDKAGDISKLAVALDVEPRSGAKDPTIEHAKEWVRQFKRHADDHPVFGYLPRWYWDRAGRGDLTFFDTLWASHYVSGSGSPGKLYDKVPGDWWDSYGDETVSILQFSSSGRVPGVSPPVDLDAYRGSLTKLRKIALGG